MTRYLVLEPEQLVADDLAQTIRTLDARAVVETYRSADEVLAALASGDATLILHQSAQGFLATALGQVVAERSLPHAFMSLMAETDGVPRLVMPFSELTVSDLMRRLAGRE